MTMYTQEAQEIAARLDRIEQKLDALLTLVSQGQQVRQVASTPGVPMDPLHDPRFSEVRGYIQQQQKIQAIKTHRELTGMGLKESKDAVEDLERRLGLAPPPSSSGW
ncbi:MAG: ribosomal protein L7/L12 [Candidatus Sericytochromatia bacterium]